MLGLLLRSIHLVMGEDIQSSGGGGVKSRIQPADAASFLCAVWPNLCVIVSHLFYHSKSRPREIWTIMCPVPRLVPAQSTHGCLCMLLVGYIVTYPCLAFITRGFLGFLLLVLAIWNRDLWLKPDGAENLRSFEILSRLILMIILEFLPVAAAIV